MRVPSVPARGWPATGVELSVVDLGKAGGDDGRRLGDYERLLGEAVAGDPTLFARQDVVEAAWAIVDPAIKGQGQLYEYEPGSWGPRQADKLVVGAGGWNTPR